MVGIYTIISPTNKVYIGQSWDLEKRKEDYNYKRCKGQTKIYNSISKHGWSAHKFEVALELRDDISQATLDCWEQYYIDLHRGLGCKLLNIKGAEGNGRHSEETKLKISKSNTGKKRSKDFCENMAIIMSIRRKGVPLEEKHKKKLSEVNKGRVFRRRYIPMSAEQREQISKFHTGKKFRLGVKVSEKGKISLKKAQQKRHEVFFSGRSRPVLNTETGIYYPTTKAAWKSSGEYFEFSYFRYMLKGKHPNKTSYIFV